MTDPLDEETRNNAQSFGVCPECHTPGYLVDSGPKTWMVCHEDRVKWLWEWGGASDVYPAGVVADMPNPLDAESPRSAELLESYREVVEHIPD